MKTASETSQQTTQEAIMEGMPTEILIPLSRLNFFLHLEYVGARQREWKKGTTGSYTFRSIPKVSNLELDNGRGISFQSRAWNSNVNLLIIVYRPFLTNFHKFGLMDNRGSICRISRPLY
ncbi:hypothetical protein AVEN_247004-1 [Araneus ventricosus]|uniref:Uncharacterized protein n=1 Tax=Araneus ventricosus TaxID=182803 RepID=A0A4Y2JYH9_ARAVE|nr:hypothetical protein AVEN_247004-1 [Araneus ventricosus]